MADDNLTPGEGSQGTTVRDAAAQIAGLLDDDGHFNPTPDDVSRAHPDYDENADDRAGGQDRDTKGRFRKAAPEDDELDDVAAQQDLDPEPDDDSDLAAADTDLDTKGSDSLDAEADDADTDDDPIETVAQLADALDMPAGDLVATLSHSFKAAGEDVTVTLAELESGYQKDADYRRSTAKLATDRRDFDVDIGNRMQAFDAQNAGLNHAMTVAEQIITAELNTDRMKTMRDEDPAEWSARRDEIGARLGFLRQARDQAAGAYMTYVQGSRAELRNRELTSLGESGEWGENERTTVRGVMNDMGFTDAELSLVTDSRLVRGVLELHSLRNEVRELRGQMADAQDTAKRIKRDVPKMQKPGKQVSKRARGKKLDRTRANQLKGRLRKSGRVEDAAAIIETML